MELYQEWNMRIYAKINKNKNYTSLSRITISSVNIIKLYSCIVGVLFNHAFHHQSLMAFTALPPPHHSQLRDLSTSVYGFVHLIAMMDPVTKNRVLRICNY